MSEQENQNPEPRAARSRAEQARDHYASLDMTQRLDDAFGKRRESESLDHWAERERAWRGAPSAQAKAAQEAEEFKRANAKFMATVEAERAKVAAEAEAKRQADVLEARAAFDAHKARTADDEALSWFRQQQARAANPGRV